MSTKTLSVQRARLILDAAAKTRILVLGDLMLDQFIWGSVSRISPEAPVSMSAVTPSPGGKRTSGRYTAFTCRTRMSATRDASRPHRQASCPTRAR